MLSIHLYKHSKFQAGAAQDNRTVIVDGKNLADLRQGERKFVPTEKVTSDEEVIMVALDDIRQITYSAGFSKGIDADVRWHIERTYASSENCCDKCCREPIKIASDWRKTVVTVPEPKRRSKYLEEDLPLPRDKRNCRTKCCDRFRCWCCRKKALVKLTRKTQIIEDREAHRVITMTIEYSKYSSPDSASNARLLSQGDQLAYYKEIFKPGMPLKVLKSRYPSEAELEKILNQQHRKVFGLVYEEPVLEFVPGTLIVASVVAAQMREVPWSIEVLALQEQPTTRF